MYSAGLTRSFNLLTFLGILVASDAVCVAFLRLCWSRKNLSLSIRRACAPLVGQELGGAGQAESSVTLNTGNTFSKTHQNSNHPKTPLFYIRFIWKGLCVKINIALTLFLSVVVVFWGWFGWFSRKNQGCCMRGWTVTRRVTFSPGNTETSPRRYNWRQELCKAHGRSSAASGRVWTSNSISMASPLVPEVSLPEGSPASHRSGWHLLQVTSMADKVWDLVMQR